MGSLGGCYRQVPVVLEASIREGIVTSDVFGSESTIGIEKHRFVRVELVGVVWVSRELPARAERLRDDAASRPAESFSTTDAVVWAGHVLTSASPYSPSRAQRCCADLRCHQKGSLSRLV